jgi:Flp pilus assembly protein TadD, contains TPR repeats
MVLNAQLHDGLLKLRDRDYAGSAARFRELTKRGIDSFESHYYFGEALVGLGRWREAAAEFERAIPRLPGFAASYLTLADCRIAMGDRSGAIAALRQGERAVPTDPRMYRRLGELYRDSGDLQQAANLFREATARDPGEASQWNSLGMILGAEGNLNEAERVFRKAIERDPREPRYTYKPGSHAAARRSRRRSGALLPKDAGVESAIFRRGGQAERDRKKVTLTPRFSRRALRALRLTSCHG